MQSPIRIGINVLFTLSFKSRRLALFMTIGTMVDSMQDSPAIQCVLRVFNGPLQGCEFNLAQYVNFFLVGPEARFCAVEHVPSVPQDAVYIPLDAGGCNFEVLLDDNAHSGCQLRVFGPLGVEERTLAFQALENIEGLQIAVRPADESWLPELLLPITPAPHVPDSGRVPGSRNQQLGVGLALLLALGGAVFAWQVSRPSPVSSVEALIRGADAEMTVLYGRDRAVYVFADTERQAGWGRQVLVRNGYSATQLLTPYGERARLEALLLEQEPRLAFHRIDLADPAQPRLLVSAQRNVLTPQDQLRVQALLRDAAPYARDVLIVSSDDGLLARQAEQGLQRLALPFTRQANDDSVTYRVEGSLADVELQALTSYVTRFNQQWGDRYVNFAIELKDDWLKGKSFQYGPQGYIKMTPSSWYFPKPL